MIVNVTMLDSGFLIEGSDFRTFFPPFAPLVDRMRGKRKAQFQADFSKAGSLEIGDEVRSRRK